MSPCLQMTSFRAAKALVLVTLVVVASAAIVPSAERTGLGYGEAKPRTEHDATRPKQHHSAHSPSYKAPHDNRYGARAGPRSDYQALKKPSHVVKHSKWTHRRRKRPAHKAHAPVSKPELQVHEPLPVSYMPSPPVYKEEKEGDYKDPKYDDYKDPKKGDYKEPKKDDYTEPKKDDYKEPKKDDYKEPKKDDYKDPKKDDYKDPKKDDYKEPKKDDNKDPKKGDYKDPKKDDYKDPKKDDYKDPKKND
jgi:hypothetical protein